MFWPLPWIPSGSTGCGATPPFPSPSPRIPLGSTGYGTSMKLRKRLASFCLAETWYKNKTWFRASPVSIAFVWQYDCIPHIRHFRVSFFWPAGRMWGDASGSEWHFVRAPLGTPLRIRFPRRLKTIVMVNPMGGGVSRASPPLLLCMH